MNIISLNVDGRIFCAEKKKKSTSYKELIEGLNTLK